MELEKKKDKESEPLRTTVRSTNDKKEGGRVYTEM